MDTVQQEHVCMSITARWIGLRCQQVSVSGVGKRPGKAVMQVVLAFVLPHSHHPETKYIYGHYR
jgi:hypothetical protein